MSKRVPVDEVLATSRANKFGRMVGRGRDNRLEPECWPHVQPSFHFTKDQRFFAIGSCFARNIVKRLALDGYNVLEPTIISDERRNRYTPPAIFQELAWAKAIFDRGDEVRDSDIVPMLLDMGNGRWADPWCLPEKVGTEHTLDRMIERRKALYSYFRGAFVADVVIITLGLIEAWWDEVSQSYVEFDTAWARRADRDRFQFERLTFGTCRDYVERTLKLLLDGRRRILMTTSPVILMRTFTADDVIVANNHSKSVLRAIAGELADAYEGVDYFPSYEIATLTRRPEVWEDDLIHIQPGFIARIMQHVTNAYVPGSVGADARTLMQMANLVEALQFDAAKAIYDAVGEAIWDCANPAVHVAALRLSNRSGEEQRAIRHALQVNSGDDLLFANHPEWMFDVARVLSRSNQHQGGGNAILDRIVAACSGQPDLFQQIFVERQRAGDDEALRDLIPLILRADVDHPALFHKVCAKLHEFGQTEEALALADRQLARTPDNGLMLARRARLLLALERLDEAIETLTRLRSVEPENAWAHLTLARTLFKARRVEEALEAADSLLARFPEEAQALSLKARLLAKLGRNEHAAEAARQAARVGASDAGVMREIGALLRGAAA